MSLVVHIDGSCWPNPNGTCRYGFVVKRGEETLQRGHGLVGKGKGMSNNVGEYKALIEAMKWLAEQGLNKEQTVFKSDSMLLVKQMKGRWHVRGGAYENYFLRAQELKFKFPLKEFVWIPREQNTEADELSTMEE